LLRYLQYAANADEQTVANTKVGLENGELHPRNVKVDIAKRVVDLYYSKYNGEEAGSPNAGQLAFEEFERIFKNKELPDEIDEVSIKCEDGKINIMDLLVQTNLVPSKKEARRLIEQGGVNLDNEKVSDPMSFQNISEKKLLKVGKRKFLYVIAKIN